MTEQLILIFTIIAGAATIPFLARTFRIPSATIEVILGICLFNTVMTREPDWFLLLKQIGFIYLMFIAGMEVDLTSLLKQPKALVLYSLIALLSLAVTPLIFIALGFSFYIGIAVAVVSAAIVVAVLKETGMIKTAIGSHITGIAVMGELLSIAILTGIDVYHEFGLTIMAAIAVVKLIALLIVAVLFLKILYLTAWWNPQWIEKVMESDDPVEEGIRAVIAIAFAGALLAHFAGVEAILGSFMAGVVFSYVFKSKGRFEEKINAVGFGFFTPFFFIGVGAGFDIGLAKSAANIMLALFMTGMILVSNIYPVLLARLLKVNLRESLSIALLLSSPLSMIVVAGTLGVKMGFLTAETNSILILTALMASLVYPSLFRLASRKLVKA